MLIESVLLHKIQFELSFSVFILNIICKETTSEFVIQDYLYTLYMLVVRTKVYSNAILCEAILLNLYFKCWYFQGTRKVVLGLSLFAEITNIGLLTINYVAMYLSLGFFLHHCMKVKMHVNPILILRKCSNSYFYI